MHPTLAVCSVHQHEMCLLIIWPLAPVFLSTNARWCLFLTVLHLVLFYENRLQDHHLVIPSVLQGLRALVSLCPAAPGHAPEWFLGDVTLGHWVGS